MSTEHLKDFRVIEFRRYTIKDGERENFARYFETFFPEAFQQLGSMVFGQFFERGNDSRFTWIRGYKDMDARAIVNASFYYGPLWKEHSSTINDRLLDHTDVLLLQPLSPGRGIPVLTAVDPVNEANGAQGVLVAQIFAIKEGLVQDFSKLSEATFAGYRQAGAREVGVLNTLDVPNNFPRLPFRTDGPYLVWLGIIKDEQMLQTKFQPLAERSMQSLTDTGLLRGAPELVFLDPSRRSRLRWLHEGEP